MARASVASTIFYLCSLGPIRMAYLKQRHSCYRKPVSVKKYTCSYIKLYKKHKIYCVVFISHGVVEGRKT